MRIFLIDNQTKRIPELHRLLKDHEVITRDPEDITTQEAEQCDVIILSGGSHYSVYGHEDYFAKELDLIRNTNVPVIGICLGFELICHAFGSELQQKHEKIHGMRPVEVVVPNTIFGKECSFDVYEAHRWVVIEAPKDFSVLARSATGLEIIRHNTRPIYAFQFHPEMCVDISYGDEVFGNVLAEIAETHLQNQNT